MSDTVDFWDDDEWEDLLDYIGNGDVIPVVGPELVLVETDSGPRPLYQVVANHLAQRAKVSTDGLAGALPLNQVVCRILESGGDKQKLYTRIARYFRDTEFEIAAPLRELASITHFKLFVSVTFDPLLLNAVNATRFNGTQGTDEIGYSYTEPEDIESEIEDLKRPVVYHLMGKLSSAPEFAIDDEDMLEFICKLQDRAYCPQTLFSELRSKHLLLLGCNFSDWLTRLFIRMTNEKQLSDPKRTMELLVDRRSDDDASLSTFLRHFSGKTIVVPGSSAEFVTELARRWRDRHGDDAGDDVGDEPPRPTVDEVKMADGAIFLSYASQDVDAVGKIRSALQAENLDVWFDKQALLAGDDWDQKIRRNINNCSLFLPVVSRRTESRVEGFFRDEWKLAAERARRIAEGVPFVLPIFIDDIDPQEAKTPSHFKSVQGTGLAGGQGLDEFVERIKQLQREYFKRQDPKAA